MVTEVVHEEKCKCRVTLSLKLETNCPFPFFSSHLSSRPLNFGSWHEKKIPWFVVGMQFRSLVLCF
uniref:Uncharacterized protein n=1 Tax=Rhizophora mucronata TaxID=61149 RepID=A0A2P2QA05_RHIMU